MTFTRWSLTDFPGINRKVGFCFLACVLITNLSATRSEALTKPEGTDVIVVGAGIAGLSAAIEMARGGARVTVVDMNSVGAGHAILANGFAIVDTPLQKSRGFDDDPDKAMKDWLRYSSDGDPDWVQYYAENSRALIYDWLLELGLDFDDLSYDFANRTIPRFHFTKRGAAPVIIRIYSEATKHSNIDFIFNTEVFKLVQESGKVTGVRLRNLRDNTEGELVGKAVVLATGGFASNLEKVLENWPADQPVPDRLLISSGKFARGLGLDLAEAVGAVVTDLDKHYIYTYGLPDPDNGSVTQHSIGFTNPSGIWVNGEGRRFVNLYAPDKEIYDAVIRQKPAGYWIIFDRDGIGSIDPKTVRYRGNWEKYHREVMNNPDLVQQADNIRELAHVAGLPERNLVETVQRYNNLVKQGVDQDFGRFPTKISYNSTQRLVAPDALEVPPFFAVRIYPNAVKSMGGVAIDRETHVIESDGTAIPGLFAAGEVTGSARINGSHGLNGMFLGPSLMMGRIAGQSVLKELSDSGDWQPVSFTISKAPAKRNPKSDHSLTLQELSKVLQRPRPGYWHFETSHKMVLERDYECDLCHSELVPQREVRDKQGMLAQLNSCNVCH